MTARRLLLAVAAAMAMLGFGGAARAEYYGLVIGIDDYQHVDKLDGAANDARDIAQALRKLKAKEVRLLLDRQADRDSVLAAWKDIVGTAKPGDTVFLTFAGHGAKVPLPGRTGFQQFVLLADFNVRGEGTYQRIIDAEFGEMLRSAPRLHIVFVVDTCHAGTMTRSYGASPGFKVRSVILPPLQDDRLPPVSNRPGMRGPAEEDGNVRLSHVAHLGAVPPDELDPEILIDGAPRGALSYAVARALEGEAGDGKGGVLASADLESFIRRVVRMKTDGQQHPEIAIRGDFQLALPAQDPSNTVKTDLDKPRALSLSIINAGPSGPEALAQKLRGVALAPPGAAALTWDAARGEITNQLGDVIAYGPTSEVRALVRVNGATPPAADPQADLGRVQMVVDKMLMVDTLKGLAEHSGIDMALAPDDKVHRDGQSVRFSIAGQKLTFLTVFNLSSDGTVNFLYPLNSERARDPLEVSFDRAFSLELKVGPPFGADHLLAVATAQPLTGLHRVFEKLDGKPGTLRLMAALENELRDKPFQIGVNVSFSAPQ